MIREVVRTAGYHEIAYSYPENGEDSLSEENESHGDSKGCEHRL
jgi:hypothetical protein